MAWPSQDLRLLAAAPVLPDGYTMLSDGLVPFKAAVTVTVPRLVVADAHDPRLHKRWRRDTEVE